MRTSTTTLLAALMIGTLGLTGSASACGGGGGYGGYGYGYNNSCYNHKKVVVKKIYIEPCYDRCYHPNHCFTYVCPGDTWGDICYREYGNRNLWRNLCSYNGFRTGMPLVVGQKLMLPVVNTDGSLTASSAPAGTPFVAETPAAARAPAVSSQSSAPSANIQIDSEPSLPSVAVGSTLALDGVQFGSEQGAVRLRISGLSMAAEVIEWNATSLKVKLPELDLTSSMRADIEVIRADGSLASQSSVQLTPAVSRLAMGN